MTREVNVSVNGGVLVTGGRVHTHRSPEGRRAGLQLPETLLRNKTVDDGWMYSCIHSFIQHNIIRTYNMFIMLLLHRHPLHLCITGVIML